MPDDHSPREPTPERVRDALRTVTDPDLGDDVVASGLVDGVDVTDGTVTVDASFAGLSPDGVDAITEQMRQSVFELPGVERVRVVGTHGDGVGDSGDGHGSGAAGDSGGVHGGDAVDGPDGVDRILAVASAKGGVGKTTVATQLARALGARGESVGLFDADVYGPNVPALLDVDGPIESTADGRADPVDADDLSVMSVGCLANDEPLAWRGAMAHEAVLDLLTDTAWDGLDTLVVDLPPGTGDIVLTVLQSVPVDGVVLVTTPFPTAASDTGRSAALFREQGVPVLGAVVNMAGFTCPTCGDDHAPFGSDPDVDADVLAQLPIDDALRDATGPVPADFADLAAEVVDRLAETADFEVPGHALDLRGVPRGARFEQLAAEFEALDPGESLVARTDSPPRPLVTALTDRVDPESLDVDTARRGPEEWAIRVATPSPASAGEAGE